MLPWSLTFAQRLFFRQSKFCLFSARVFPGNAGSCSTFLLMRVTFLDVVTRDPHFLQIPFQLGEPGPLGFLVGKDPVGQSIWAYSCHVTVKGVHFQIVSVKLLLNFPSYFWQLSNCRLGPATFRSYWRSYCQVVSIGISLIFDLVWHFLHASCLGFLSGIAVGSQWLMHHAPLRHTLLLSLLLLLIPTFTWILTASCLTVALFALWICLYGFEYCFFIISMFLIPFAACYSPQTSIIVIKFRTSKPSASVHTGPPTTQSPCLSTGLFAERGKITIVSLFYKSLVLSPNNISCVSFSLINYVDQTISGRSHS